MTRAGRALRDGAHLEVHSRSIASSTESVAELRSAGFERLIAISTRSVVA